MISRTSRSWLEIASIEGVSPDRWARLCRSIPAGEISRMLGSCRGRTKLERLLGGKVGEPDRRFVEKQIESAQRSGSRFVSLSDPAYPVLLREIAVPPPLLFIRGDLSITKKPAVCIVGSRRASRRGRVTAHRLAFELSRRDFVVISGLARGIDTAAHEGALADCGGTCAVLGCGIDVAYPPENASLALEISRAGCILSEFPFGTPPLRHHFPRRNRLLSGLSLGVVVVEAGLGSGALGTARWAAEQNREVFAVPGPVEFAGSRGPHRLIREGARLVEGVEDILAEFPFRGRVVEAPGALGPGTGNEPFSDDERKVLSALELNPKHIDEVVQICHIPATSVLTVLLELEIRGVVEQCGGGTYAVNSGRIGAADGDT